MHDTLRFFRHWLADPVRIGAVAPSGAALAELITSEITGRSGRIVELGAGTGVFTQALRARGVREAHLILVERNAAFAALLQARFPHARTLRMDAALLERWAGDERPDAGAVISSLPLLGLPANRMRAILLGAFACLARDGALYQIGYGPSCPLPRGLLDELGLQATRLGRVWRNVPPATVHRIRRAAAMAA